MNNNTEHPIIQTSDIISKYKELETVQSGIGQDKQTSDEYVRIHNELAQERIDESAYSYNNVQQHASYLVTGNDYHADLDALHKHITPFVPEGHTSNAHDNYIHDVLKRGKPSGDVVSHLMDVMHNDSNPEKNTNNVYLKTKWQPFLDVHTAHKPEIRDMTSHPLTEDEVRQYSHMGAIGNRLLSHRASSAIFELHPTKGLQYTGVIGNYRHLYNSRGDEHPDFHKEAESLHKSYESYGSPHITDYTGESASINRTLHLRHKGIGPANDELVFGKPVSEIDTTSNGLSEHIAKVVHPTHMPDFHVYSGMYSESNPNKPGTHVNEDGHYVLHAPSFTSTSLDRDTALEFARSKSNDDLKRMS
jgi:hypothetical protein